MSKNKQSQDSTPTSHRFGKKPGLRSGRPSVSKMISLREDEWEVLNAEALKRGITRSELVRRCIAEVLFP